MFLPQTWEGVTVGKDRIDKVFRTDGERDRPMGDFGNDAYQPPLWERLASGLAAFGTFAFFFSAVGYGWYSLIAAMGH